VILPETRSGRMKLRWVNWLTNWITSARSRLSNDITTVFALLWISFLSTAGVFGGSVIAVAVGVAGETGVCGAIVFLYGGEAGRAGGGGAGGCCTGPGTGGRVPGLTKTPRFGGTIFRCAPRCGGFTSPSISASC